MAATTSALPAPGADTGSSDEFLRVTLWAAQAVVAFGFCFFGLFKLTGPMSELIREFKWPADYPPLFTRALGLIDIVGGIGLVLPALTRIQPRLTVLAALCAVVLQVLAIAFHSLRGEFAVLPLNGVLLPLAAYVWWGRRYRAVIAPLQGAAARQRTVSVTLWAAQWVVAAIFCGAGLFKLTAPIAQVAAALPFAGDLPVAAVRAVGMVDIIGGLGILLPALTRVLPRLTPWAAIGCMTVQLLAMALHASRREWSVLPLNALLFVLAAYVLWGRSRIAVVLPLQGAAAQRRVVDVTLWAAQLVVAVVFIFAGMFKLAAPIADLAVAMRWPGELPPAVVRLLGAIDLAGGLGIVLPALTRIRPRLTVLAAAGCALLQVLAIGFHGWRGEWSVLPLNAVLLPCALLVLWGRARLAPVVARD